MKNGDSNFFFYRGRPLVRKGDVFYYGSMGDEVVAMLKVESVTEFKGLKLSDRIELKLILTDPSIDLQNIIIKQSVRNGLFDALDIADIWISRFIKKHI